MMLWRFAWDSCCNYIIQGHVVAQEPAEAVELISRRYPNCDKHRPGCLAELKRVGPCLVNIHPELEIDK